MRLILADPKQTAALLNLLSERSDVRAAPSGGAADQFSQRSAPKT